MQTETMKESTYFTKLELSYFTALSNKATSFYFFPPISKFDTLMPVAEFTKTAT